MVAPVEKRSSNMFCEFHNDKGHSTDECVQLKKHIEELVRAGKLSHLIKEIRQDKDQQKTATPKDTEKKAEKHHENFKVAIHLDFLDQEIAIRGPSDMTGVPRSIAEHRLNIRDGYPPVRQKKRGQSSKRSKAIQEEDCYPLPEIDWKVESLCGYPFKCFLDAYKGCHQIQMTEVDEEKTAFHTPQGVYCYTKMPFGLKNAGATYQRLVDKAFDKQVGQNLEVYVDDLVIKSHTETELLRDIEETFRTLQKINMKLNPKNYTFGAEEGMFLGYMIVPEGIKPCPDKVSLQVSGKILAALQNLKEIHQKSDFHWTSEAEQAFKHLKQHISELPMLVAPRTKEELIMYLSASHGAVGAVLMTERETIQTLVYFVSRPLQGAELNYTPMEKLILALVCAAKRLRRYFQAHLVAVITDQPIKQIISRPDVAGRLQKWSIMLGEYNITYRPRTSVKGQILTDFLVEKPDEVPANTSVKEVPQELWTLFTDGSSCVDGSGDRLILTSPDGTEFTYALRFQFAASNNEAEYDAQIAGLRIAAQMGVRNVQVSVDSKLVANQVLGTYIAKEYNMIKYLEKTKSLVGGFDSFSISQVPRSKNKKADALSKIASTSFAHVSKQFLVEILKEKSIQEKEVTVVVEEEGPTWMMPILEYLKDGTLPGDHKKESKLCIKARQYELWEGILYRRSFLKPWLRCVGPLQADYIIREIREGSCNMHVGPRSVVAKAMRSGYYWPTMHRDTRDMTRKCKDCQGIDITGPFPEGPGKVKFLIVVMDYFTKWIEAKAVATISGTQVKKFVWDNIHFPSVKHPQSNRLVKRENKSLGEGIKTRLGEGNKNWLEELPHVLWSHRTMIKSSNDDTPFSLTYGTEAVIPAEIGMPTYRTAVVDAVHNDEELRLNLDLLEERRERTTIREAKAKLNMKKYYKARVRGVTFRPGDFVYRSNDASHAVDG
ncbi:reverse transcriptase domain-containing protein [Tanacetum coccineum]